MRPPANYVGRFAPSPSGPLHFGSLLAAVCSFLQARVAGGRWLVRIEDIDPPRAQPGAVDDILRTLEAYGFEWDGDVGFQSGYRDRHLAIIESLAQRDLAYPCGCSRRDLADAPRGPLGIIYPGTCRGGSGAAETAIRLKTGDEPISFDDRLQGRATQRLRSESGDFVIRRRDGLIAYNLAVVIDDADSGVTEVVRGIDLLDSTPRHIYLQDILGFQRPDYLHIPVAINTRGQKLSKLTGAAALPDDRPQEMLVNALRALGQQPPATLSAEPLATVWAWACEHWQVARLAKKKSVKDLADPLARPGNGLR